MTEFDRETKVARQLLEETAQDRPPSFGREGRRELDEDDLKLGRERLERPQELGELRAAIVEMAGMGDLARELAGEAKGRGGAFHPAPEGAFRRHVVEGGIDLHRRKIMRVKFEPARRRQDPPGRMLPRHSSKLQAQVPRRIFC